MSLISKKEITSSGYFTRPHQQPDVENHYKGASQQPQLFYDYSKDAMMSAVTGTGCQLSALTAAFCAANPDKPLEAAAAAVCAMGLAGEAAHSRLSRLDGNATYRNYIIDAIFNMTPEQLEEGARYEMR